MKNIIKNKNFLLLIIGKMVSLFGSEIQKYALSLYVLKVTGSATKFAFILSLAIIPRIIFGPFIGVFIDRFDKKKIIIYSDILSGIVIGIYSVLYSINSELSLNSVYTLVIILTFISMIFQPTITAVLPIVVKKEQLSDAYVINDFAVNIGSFLAPVLAGALLGFSGLFVVLVINCISFIFSAISESFIYIPQIKNKFNSLSVHQFKEDFINGIKYLNGESSLKHITILSCIINFAFPVISSLGIAFISKGVLKVSDVQYGIIESCLAVAVSLSPLVAKVYLDKMSTGEVIVRSIFYIILLTFLLALITTDFYIHIFKDNMIPYISLIIISIFINLFASVVGMATSIRFQKMIQPEYMGRATTVMSTGSMIFMPIGYVLFGQLFDRIPAYCVIALAALIFFFTITVFKHCLVKEIE